MHKKITYLCTHLQAYLCYYLFVKKKNNNQKERKKKIEIKLNTGVKVKLFEPSSFLSDNAFQAYSNSSCKIGIDEKNDYYIFITQDAICGPINWEKVQEFFNELYNLYTRVGM